LKLPINSRPRKRLKILFLDKETQYRSQTDERLNIILSPSYYWFKKATLPVKYVTQAQALAASQFDGIVPEGSYKYTVIKQEDLFWLFAYDEASIAQKLKELGIKPSQVEAFYLAQYEFQNLKLPVAIAGNKVLVQNDGVVSVMPRAFVDAVQTLDAALDHLKLSKHRITLNLFQNSVLDEKWIYRFSAVSIVFIVLYLASYLLLKSDLKALRTEQLALTQQYKLPQTSFQLKSLMRSLTSKENRQLALRQHLKKLFALRLSSGDYVKKFTFTPKGAQYEIVLSDIKHAESIKKELQKAFTVKSAKVVDKTFYIGVSL